MRLDVMNDLASQVVGLIMQNCTHVVELRCYDTDSLISLMNDDRKELRIYL